LKSAGYFPPLLKGVREVCMMAAGLDIDNKETKKQVKEVMDELLTVLDILFYSLEAFQAECFDIERLCRVRTQCVLADRKQETAKRRLRKIEHAEGGVVNEELRERLQQWRMERFKKDNVPAYTIMHQSTLLQIATLIPTSKKELLSIKGFGEASYKKYGEEILAMCSEFSNNL
jgi:superfamily II DNA helicase RecQ